MIAFRDSEGRYGLMDEFCAHRGASLWFGRNEGSGLRCPYHGWKYDVTGQAIEIPSEPEGSTFCAHVKLTSYPLRQDRRRALDLHGRSREAAAAARVRVRDGAVGADLHLEAVAGVQLAAGLRGRNRLQSRVVPARRRTQERPAVQGSQGQRVQHGRSQALLRGRRLRRRTVRRRPTQRRGGHLLLADHAMGDALLHDGPAARRPPGARPLLGPDRRRELLGLFLRLPPGAAADAPRCRR